MQSKSTWGGQSVKDIPNFTCICVYGSMYGCMYLCHASRPNEKRYRPEIWHTYSHRLYLKTNFLSFWKNEPEGRHLRKTAVSRGFYFTHISSISLFLLNFELFKFTCLSFFYIPYWWMDPNHDPFTSTKWITLIIHNSIIL